MSEVQTRVTLKCESCGNSFKTWIKKDELAYRKCFKFHMDTRRMDLCPMCEKKLKREGRANEAR